MLEPSKKTHSNSHVACAVFEFSEKGRAMQKVFTSILKCIPKVVSVCVLMSLLILSFGVFGFVLFSEQ